MQSRSKFWKNIFCSVIWYSTGFPTRVWGKGVMGGQSQTKAGGEGNFCKEEGVLVKGYSFW